MTPSIHLIIFVGAVVYAFVATALAISKSAFKKSDAFWLALQLTACGFVLHEAAKYLIRTSP